MKSYKELVDPILTQNNLVVLSEEDHRLISGFVRNVIERKSTESHHQVDGSQEAKRWSTGAGGEVSLEKYLKIKFVDLSIGTSNDYHKPDLSPFGIDVGVKTVEYGKYPIIFKKSYKQEIIIIKKSENDFYVCGLASIEVLNTYQSDDLVLSPLLRQRGTKTGFYGFEHLKSFRTIDELRALLPQ
jgi:hypothetical protein